MKVSTCIRVCILLAALFFAASRMRAQVPFALDPGFIVDMDRESISSVLPLPNGQVIVSGRMYLGNSLQQRYLAKLNFDGTRDLSFDPWGGGGRIQLWNDRFYVGNYVRRYFMDGILDNDFALANALPTASTIQTGDFHVYPDGRILFSGVHELNDTSNGYVGLYSLVWYTNTGNLDTTQHHRRSDGAIYRIMPLTSGDLMLSGTITSFEDQPVGRIIKVHADGELDTTFVCHIGWGVARGMYEQPDGKMLFAGSFLFEGEQDTLHLIRLLPDGSRDDSFNNTLVSGYYQNPGLTSWDQVSPLGQDRLIICGQFNSINGSQRGGIALLDTAGNLLDQYFDSPGAGPLTNGQLTIAGVAGITPAPDGSYYIYGSYHGYNDGTTNDPSQRMVSRLYGLDVGVEEEPLNASGLQVYPNPADQWITIAYLLPLSQAEGQLVVRDALGRVMHTEAVHSRTGQVALDTRTWSAGSYTTELTTVGLSVAREKLLIKH